ncbi:hypothetical protein ACGFW5_01940 [Streptomyces sp. NPDC048416]|uniref:hypothetical protein n=1 Tax=Streptomyces sp. NPDC048416 TaxID=3365546 RepID=UPI003712FD20
MTYWIIRILERLLLRLRPAGPEPVPPHPALPRVAAFPDPEPIFRGEDSPLVRPYLVAHERDEARRRRVLWLTARGVEIRPYPNRRAGVGA